MDDFNIEKIDLSKRDIIKEAKPSPKPAMARSRKKFKFFKKHIKTISIVVAVLVVIFGFLGWKSFVIYKDGKKTYAQAKLALAAAKTENVVDAKDQLVKTQTQIAVLKKDVDSIGFMGYVPIIGWYYNDGRHMINASVHGVAAAIVTADSLIPYADVLGLKGQGSFVAGSAQDRIRLAVNTLGKVVPRIDDIEKEMTSAQSEIDQVDANHYPNFWVFKKARTEIQSVKNLTDQGVLAVQQGKPLIKVLPQLLGEDDTKYYLVLFQNDKELRPTGGFLTYYSVFKVEQGVVSVDTSSDIYTLDDSIPSHPAAPYIIANYLPKVNQWYIRDSNLSPDFKKSMDDFMTFYKKSSLYHKVDGIIAIDTHFLVNILNILGGVQVDGETFDASNDAQCDCPEVVYALENQISRPVNYIKTNRKGLLGDLLYATMQKALSSSPKEYWGRLVQQGMVDASEKHILFDLFDPGAQQGIEALNWGGRVKDFKGDYLNINDGNFGGQKSNLYVRNKVRVDYSTQNGKITKTVTINYNNDHPGSDCNLERGGLCLNATLRNYQRVYVPAGSVLTDSHGAGKAATKQDLGKTYFEGFFFVNPLGTAQVTYTYTLPFTVQNGKSLPVLIQKQPGIYDTPYQIYVNGKLQSSFNLTTDKELDLKLN